MDLVHLHLLLNHVPVIGLALALLIIVWGLVRKSNEVLGVGFGVIVLAAIAAAGTFLTGEPAEDRVGGLAGISKAAIEQHEEVANAALVSIITVAVIALLSVFMRWQRTGAVAVLVTGLVAFALIARAANLGGQIRHTEIAGAAAPVSGGGEDHDDD